MELKEKSLKILNEIVESEECPFEDECPSDCPCKIFNNSCMSCLEIARSLKRILGNESQKK